MDIFLFELISLITLSTLFSGYHLLLFWVIKKHPLRTAHGQNEKIRMFWVQTCLDERKDLLAVQTLRNFMMSSSLLATTALTLSSLIAAFFIKGGDEDSKINEMSENLSHHFTVEHKLFSMIILFTLSFFSYMQSVRINSHAGVMFVIGSGNDRPAFLTPEYISKLLFRANLYHTAGTRLFYAAFLTVLWLFGPVISTIAAFFLIVLLVISDFSGGVVDKSE